ncbi:hypothetical protein M569_06367 [Genlisea aurea]|uniref:RNase H type-1 domain-containing protein n=1 Tax=Genlisea aurea TaxID=192259 RepID=S8CNX0_9LAMI|nr:hypothetical protein M569_06367 [Genlisea aurea]
MALPFGYGTILGSQGLLVSGLLAIVPQIQRSIFVSRISSTLIGGFGIFSDRFMWFYTKSGAYSIKSAYHLLCNMSRAVANVVVDLRPFYRDFWKRYWTFSFPSRILLFGWKLARGILPVKAELCRRHLTSDVICEICGLLSESWFHLLAGCDWTRLVSAILQLPTSLFSREYHSPIVWLQFCLMKLSPMEFRRLLVAIWAIWYERNSARRMGNPPDPIRTAQFIWNYMTALDLSDLFGVRSERQPRRVNWVPPPRPFLKLNFDGGLVGFSRSGIGGVIRDHRGFVIAWFAHAFSPQVDSECGEFLAARRVLELAQFMRLENVVLEGDCLSCITAINDDVDPSSALGNIIQDIKVLLSGFQSWSAHHMPRDANKVAHLLAKSGLVSTTSFHDQNLPATVYQQRIRIVELVVTATLRHGHVIACLSERDN